MYSMKYTRKEVGLTYDALKFYCNQGLVPNVKRDKNNCRIFDDDDIEWLKTLKCLKKCNMSIAEMKEYLKLCQGGEKTIPARKEMLARKKKELEEKIVEIHESMDFIDYKQKYYDDVLSGKEKYQSKLAKN